MNHTYTHTYTFTWVEGERKLWKDIRYDTRARETLSLIGNDNRANSAVGISRSPV